MHSQNAPYLIAEVIVVMKLEFAFELLIILAPTPIFHK